MTEGRVTPTKEQSKPRKKQPSRLERRRSKLRSSCDSCPEGYRQSQLTEFFKVLNVHDMIIKENEDLKLFVKYLTEKITSLDQNNDDNIAIISDMPVLMQALVKCHKNNKNKTPTAWRYKDELIRNFSIFSRDLAGKQSYEFWSKNLPLPSLSSVALYSDKCSKPIVEGEFRFQELVKYLDDRKLGREIWVSEDATRIKVKVQYDARRNQLVGLVPNLDKNGLPKVGSFVADSAENIEKQLSSECASNYEYVIMAQPMADIPPFLLCLFGTNNKFTTSQVLQRWKWLVQEAKTHEVVILGFSSDGDPKMLSAMNKWTFQKELTVLPAWKNMFFAPMEVASAGQVSDENILKSFSPLCIQDTVHTVAKMKTQLLKNRSDTNFWPMGSYVGSGTFLKILVEGHSKLDHGLCASDLDSKDKMNFRSVQKISDTRVTDVLDSIPGSKGTKCYLIMLRGVLDSFLDKTLEADKRIHLIWRTVFFLRHWRNWLQQNNYKVTLNFITANTYQCIEISAHSLVNIYRRCRDSDKLHLFLPWLMGSQACEGFFRDARSCSEMFHTAVNMTAYEFQQKAKKIVRLLETGHELNKHIIVPRHHKKMKGVDILAGTLRNQKVFSDRDIFKILSTAQNDALSWAQELDMFICGNVKSQTVPLFITRVGTTEDVEDEDDDENSEDEIIDLAIGDNDMEIPDDVAEDIILGAQNGANIPDEIRLPDNSPFVVTKEGEKRSIIRKSTLIWSLTSKHTLSSNRLERVKAAEESLRKKRQEESDRPVCAENISVGDWVVFNSCPLPKRQYVGRILNFTYLSGSGKEREYSKHYVPTVSPENAARGIGCLGDWYTLNCEGTGTLEKFHEPAAYLNIKDYICSVPKPFPSNGTMSYNAEILSLIQEILPSNLRREKQIFKPVKCTKRKTAGGRSLFPDSDTEEDAPMDTAQTPKVSRPALETSSSSENKLSCLLRKSPRRSASPHAASSTESQISAFNSKRTSPRRSVSPLVSATVHSTEKTFAPIERPPEEGEFVLVEFEKKTGNVYYVGKVLSEVDDDNDVQVSFLYLRRNVETSEFMWFAFPHLPDEASVNLDSVKMILPKPSVPLKSFYQFDTSFEGLSVY